MKFKFLLFFVFPMFLACSKPKIENAVDKRDITIEGDIKDINGNALKDLPVTIKGCSLAGWFVTYDVCKTMDSCLTDANGHYKLKYFSEIDGSDHNELYVNGGLYYWDQKVEYENHQYHHDSLAPGHYTQNFTLEKVGYLICRYKKSDTTVLSTNDYLKINFLFPPNFKESIYQIGHMKNNVGFYPFNKPDKIDTIALYAARNIKVTWSFRGKVNNIKDSIIYNPYYTVDINY